MVIIDWAVGVRFELTELIRLNSFQDCPLKPLEHPTAQPINSVYFLLYFRGFVHPFRRL